MDNPEEFQAKMAKLKKQRDEHGITITAGDCVIMTVSPTREITVPLMEGANEKTKDAFSTFMREQMSSLFIGEPNISAVLELESKLVYASVQWAIVGHKVAPYLDSLALLSPDIAALIPSFRAGLEQWDASANELQALTDSIIAAMTSENTQNVVRSEEENGPVVGDSDEQASENRDGSPPLAAVEGTL